MGLHAIGRYPALFVKFAHDSLLYRTLGIFPKTLYFFIADRPGKLELKFDGITMVADIRFGDFNILLRPLKLSQRLVHGVSLPLNANALFIHSLHLA